MTRMKQVLTYSGILLLACIGLSSYTYFQPSFHLRHGFGGQGQKSMKLEYNFPAEGVKYLMTNKIIQTMDINGQSMQANVSSTLGCTIKSKGRTDGNLKLEVKIDTLGQQTDSPQGFSGGAITPAIGKTFNMTLSPQGKETDISEAAKITYNVEGSGPGDLSQSFYDYFPDMPAKSISPGYTWTKTDTMNVKTQTMSIFMIIISENKFEGFETADGIECAKIVSVLSGTREVRTQTQGMDIKITGPFTGSGTLLFAPAKGYFLKQSVATKMNGQMDITYPEAMTFPMVMEMTSVNEVVK
jgi:hypothetical protein